MPHGISPPHSAPRSSNAYSLLWYPSKSLRISTATGRSCNIGTHRNILYVRYHNVFSSIRTPTFLSCRTDYPATLMQHFYYRNELLARNSTGRLSTLTGAEKSTQECPTGSRRKLKLINDISSSTSYLQWSCTFHQYHCLTTKSTLFNDCFSSANPAALRFSCICYRASSLQPFIL